MGLKSVWKVPGTGRDGQFAQIAIKLWKKLTNPTELAEPRVYIIPNSTILKGYWNQNLLTSVVQMTTFECDNP